MSVKTILLHLAGEDPADAGAKARFASAETLARRFDARVIGLAIAAPFYPIGLEGSGAMSDLYAKIAAESEEGAKARAAAFTASAETAGLASEARTAIAPGGGAGSVFALHGRYADLSLVAKPVDGDGGLSRRVLEGALFETGRPVIVLPESQADFSEGALGRVMIAWDGRKEAARAVTDALPLLASAATVEICVVEGALSGGDLGEDPGADCARWLAHHGVSTNVQQISRSFGVARALLDRAANSGAQMIVMGGYGHSRLSEAIFGGVTETILSEAAVPLFMAH